MLDLGFINKNASYIETGVIDELLGENKYLVKIGNRLLKIPSVVQELKLKRGSYVVINRTDTGYRYIMNSTEKLKTYTLQEVVIDG